MKQLKIAIIGNSVALRVRPPQIWPDNKNYTVVLRNLLEQELPSYAITVENKGIGASTIYNIILELDRYIHSFPDYYILNLGVVDACTREIPLWLYRLANSNKDSLWHRLWKGIYRGFIVRNRAFWVKLRGKRSWTSEKKFKKYFTTLITELLKETNAKIIVIAINKANERIEKQLPGSTKKIKKYNEIMETICRSKSQTFLTVPDLNAEIHYPDGIHYAVHGHQIIAQHLSNLIIKTLR